MRRFILHDTAWYVPNPQGFRDLETLTQKQLPEYLHIAAYNLRENDLVYFVPPRSGGGAGTLSPPVYSQAGLQLIPPEGREELREAPIPSPGSAVLTASEQLALQQYVTGKGPKPSKADWEKMCAKARAAEKYICIGRGLLYSIQEANGLGMAVWFDEVLGPWRKKDKEAYEKRLRDPEDITTGGEYGSMYPGIHGLLAFNYEGTEVRMRIHLLGSLEMLPHVVHLLEQWRDEFILMQKSRPYPPNRAS